MLVSGFVDGQLIYILEFPFNDPLFLNKLETQLQKKFPNGDKPSSYLRSANFSFKDYSKDTIKKVFIKQNIDSFKDFINKDLFLFLKEKSC